ncbi:DUF4232 domain-containing protein [Streptomyces sp. B21-106]|uniref:DUF4232 domain-containing protein n=1 Tax=Streptomyces sp. B21-106 TaxID=3039418 RepID=UPI003FA7BF51
MTIPSASVSASRSASSPSPTGSGGGVRADRLPGGLPADSGVSAAYEVVNSTADALTYTVLFDFTTSTGGVMSNQKVTVRSVGPGRTVTGTVRLGTLAPGASRVTTVKVAEVTRVPAEEAPSEPGVCPPSGVRVTADDGDSAMGLRVVGLLLENCGTKDRTLDGYPRLSLLDDDLQPVRGVEVMKGGGGIATVAGFGRPAPGRDPEARRAGERRADVAQHHGLRRRRGRPVRQGARHGRNRAGDDHPPPGPRHHGEAGSQPLAEGGRADRTRLVGGVRAVSHG